ncbi:n-6 DNA methylase [Cryptobacterium sp. CAG:338]|nr:n-6 DNA methylase [Cryptobacterium sp. CAG:338]
MNQGLDYKQFYNVLLNLREAFHSSGRFDDSNAKLDEIVKLLCVAYTRAIQDQSFTVLDLKALASERFSDSSRTASALREMFDDVAKYGPFINADGTSIFGSNPSLCIQDSENAFAEEVVFELSKIDFKSLMKSEGIESFDVINECFGHFVRENFRNNKEDAQYMTPLEIAHPYIDTVFKEMSRDGYFDSFANLDFHVMDPTCGVGTLLLEAARKYVEIVQASSFTEKEALITDFLRNGIIGQDKVDRMVRLSKINSILYGASAENISCGNSIIGTSSIDDYEGKIDLIFTNPPFGAEFNIEVLPLSLQKSITNDCLTGKRFSSETLMLYRSMNLLKPGGYLAIVLPDSVVSSKGNNARIRNSLLAHADVQSVVELPAVAFAQAGTRTKTVILLVRKARPSGNSIVMCTCREVGFLVKERSGVPVKTKINQNDVAVFAQHYPETREGALEEIIFDNPSITAVTPHQLINGQLTPSFYSAERLMTYKALSECSNGDFEYRPLSTVALIETKKRVKMPVSDNVKHISVLHVRGDSTIDFEETEAFHPISDGRECYEDDVLFSKINPSIPRMCVVPKRPYKTVCSMEFEILRSSDEHIGPNTLCLMLKSSIVQAQIRNLTSGTSSSHNRIKTEQLEQILVPCPVSEAAKRKFASLEIKSAAVFRQKYSSDQALRENLSVLESIR